MKEKDEVKENVWDWGGLNVTDRHTHTQLKTGNNSVRFMGGRSVQ